MREQGIVTCYVVGVISGEDFKSLQPCPQGNYHVGKDVNVIKGPGDEAEQSSSNA